MRSISILLLITFCSVLSLAADFSSLPADAQKAISAAIKRDVAERNPAALEDFLLTASDGANGDYFGSSVAIDGNTVVVGSLRTYDAPSEAYVFVKPKTGWQNMTQTATLTASDGKPGDGFGLAVSVSNNTIVVGDQTASVNGVPQGAAYVYVQPSGGWRNMTETAKLSASDGVTGAEFGVAVAVNGNTIVAGAPAGIVEDPGPGSAYVFVEPPGGWANATQTSELTASDGADYDEFGTSVSINGNTVLVGAPEGNTGSGKAYIFVEPPNGWTNMTETAELLASDGEFQDIFGSSLSLNDDVAAVGAPNHANGLGAIYVFVEPANGWIDMSQTAELRPSSKSGARGTGASVSSNGQLIVAGAPSSKPQLTGSVLIFEKPASGWRNTTTPNITLAIPFSYGYDYFGGSVAVSGKTGVVGAEFAPSSLPCNPVCQAGPGQAFVFVDK